MAQWQLLHTFVSGVLLQDLRRSFLTAPTNDQIMRSIIRPSISALCLCSANSDEEADTAQEGGDDLCECLSGSTAPRLRFSTGPRPDRFATSFLMLTISAFEQPSSTHKSVHVHVWCPDSRSSIIVPSCAADHIRSHRLDAEVELGTPNDVEEKFDTFLGLFRPASVKSISIHNTFDLNYTPRQL